MANLLYVTEAKDLGRIEFYPANTLAATERPDTARFFTGGYIGATEEADTASFNVVQLGATLEATESQDTGSVDILTGEIVTLGATEAKDTASVSVSQGILSRFSVTERLDQPSISILNGTLGQLSATEPLDTASVSFSGATLLTLAGVESSDRATFSIEVVPFAYSRKAVVMNLHNHGVTEYEGFNFNGLVYFNEVFLGTNENGIYLLEGDNDLGQNIASEVVSGSHDLAARGIMELPVEAWLAYRNSGDLKLGVKMDEQGEFMEYTFDGTGEEREMRATLDRGHRGRILTYVLKNVSGAGFDLQSLRFMGKPVARKTR